MTNSIQSVRGMHDIAPDETGRVREIEDRLRNALLSFGYREVRTPIVESLELFKRSVGEVTDIVEKEMYAFADRNGDMLALRPEGTASVVRAGIQNGWLKNQQQRLWYLGPFFRHERPQKGRYRQFHQLGVETFGFSGPDMDAELIMLAKHVWNILGINANELELQINTLGDLSSRAAYRAVLSEFLKDHYDMLDEDARRRLETNPLRILDSKNSEIQSLLTHAPMLIDSVDAESREHFERLQAFLTAADIPFVTNPRLVRGLDYYTRTVFEWVTTSLGAQGTVCAGGRYDGLVAQLGGGDIPAAGFAIGIERLLALTDERLMSRQRAIDAYAVVIGEAAELYACALLSRMRNAEPDLQIQMNCGGGSMKSQMKRADRSGARLALIIADQEVEEQKISVKYLQDQRSQQLVSEHELIGLMKQK